MKWLQQNKIITLIAVVKFLLPFIIINSVWELHRDEYLYYEQGKHLASGYLENPSLIGVLASISRFLGGSFFWIKFWPALFGALTLYVTASIAKELGGKLFAQVIAALGILFSVYMRIHFLFQPNFLDIFFWTLSAFYLLRFINSQQNKYLYLLSLAIALGWWSKYSILFFATAIIISILLSKHRFLFGKKKFWFAAFFGFVLILPNLFWQYFHKFPLIHHMKELQETQLGYVNKTDFLKDQLLMLLPVAFLWVGGLFWLLKNNLYRLIAYIYFVVIILLMLGSGKSYYSLGAYPMLIAAGGVWIEKISRKRMWLRYAAISIILLLALPFLPLILPIQSPEVMSNFNKRFGAEKIGLLKWEDQRIHALQQDFADMLGWKELSDKAENIYVHLPDSIQKNTVIYCSNYGQAGALKYYGKNNDFVTKTISTNGTFLLWTPDDLNFKNIIYVGSKMPGKNNEVFTHFAKATVIDSVSNSLSRQLGDKIIFFENADTVAVKLAKEALNKMRSEFER